MSTLRVDALAGLLGLSPHSIHAMLCRHPDRLPPPIRIPGSSRLLWLESDVMDWLKSHQTAPATVKRGRGRPRKAEQVAATRDPRTVDFITGKTDQE